MVQNGDTINDGADEKMLVVGENKNIIAAKKDEVKFISGDQQNGDAKIDIGVIDKTFTGMSKVELMKYANDPFWVRLRWIFFILFWTIWAAMLVGAIMIIINAPKCAAPQALVWWKQGPLAKYNNIDKVTNKDVEQAQKLHAKGVIYELPAEDTYLVQNPEVEERIKKCVEIYKDTDIKVILDITANYVQKNSEIVQSALKDKSQRKALIWRENTSEPPTNWLAINNGSAWYKIQENNYVLSQFGEGRYDLNMTSEIIKEKLINVFRHLIELGIKGFRLSNTKYFIVSTEMKDEEVNSDMKDHANYIHTQYEFWTHSQTRFQEGLGDLLQEYKLSVKNISADTFLSVNEDLVRPEVYQLQSSDFGVDLPVYGRFTHSLAAHSKKSEKNLYNELRNTFENVANISWVQWQYDLERAGHLHISAYNMFLMLLPGVPVIKGNSDVLSNVSVIQIEHMRVSPSFMHGSFDLYHSGNLVAYSRIKSGNPGFFIVLNPTDVYATGNFSSVGLPEKMTVDLLSDNYNVTDIAVKSKVDSNTVVMSPYSAAILTYVPVKTS